MELIMKFLSLFSSTEAFVRCMWQWAPILFIGSWIVLGVFAIIGIFKGKRELDSSSSTTMDMDQLQKINSRFIKLKLFMSDGFGFIVFFLIDNSVKGSKCKQKKLKKFNFF